ncbi:MAG: OsmC family protein [Polyangiaceae bacterium]
MDPVSRFTLHVHQLDGYAFGVRFDDPAHGELRVDEGAPLGRGSAPDPSRLLGAAIANCLAASLLFCLQRKGGTVSGIRATADVEIVRNERKRMRVGRVAVTLSVPHDVDPAIFEGCRSTFEDFCTVTESVRAGIPVDVAIAQRPLIPAT